MVLALTTDTQSPGLDAREDNTDKLTERRWVEWDDSLCTATGGVLGVDAVAWY